MAKKFLLVDKIRGYETKPDKTNAPFNVLVSPSQNVLINDADKVSTRAGYSLLGAANSSTTPIEGGVVWQNSSGGEISLRSYDDELEIYTSTLAAWTRLKNSLSAVDLQFATWWSNSEGIDLLLYVDGTDGLFEWSGGITTLKSATTGPNTITKNGTTSWAEDRFLTAGTRKVIINGTEYAYTGGETTDTLTGVSADPTGEAADSNVFQAVRENTDTPAADFLSDFLKVLNNQVYVGSSTSREVYVSANDDFTDYTLSSPRVTGEGGLLTLDNIPKAFARQDQAMYISAGRDDWYKTEFETLLLSTDATAETFVVRKLKTAPGMGAQSQDLVLETGDFIAFVSHEPALRILGNIEDVESPLLKSLSNPIKPDFDDADFTNGHMVWDKNRIYISTPNDDKVFILETRENADGTVRRFWQPPQVLPARRFAIIGGVLYGHSNAVPETYKLFDGTRDRGGGTMSNTTTALSPGTMADDDSVGTAIWVNPNDAKVSDGSYAAVSYVGETISHYLKATNFGFSIPSGATINGIKVEIEQTDTGLPTGDSDENSIRIVKGGTISGDDKSTGAELPDTDTYVEYGSSTDLWGLSWTAEDINSSTFGVVFSITTDGGAIVGAVDHIRITIYYAVESKVSFKATAAYSYRNFKRRDREKNLDEYITEGYISANTVLALTLNYDFEGYSQTLDFDIRGDNDDILFQPAGGGALGTEPLGVAPIGAGAEEVTQNPKFRVINTFPKYDFFEIQAVYETDETDAQWEILAQGGNIAFSKMEPIQIKQ